MPGVIDVQKVMPRRQIPKGKRAPRQNPTPEEVARYNDKWECREGDWVIVERIVTNDFQWKIDGARLGEPYGCAFDESDPSYAALAYGMAEEE